MVKMAQEPQENSDLLTASKKVERNGNVRYTETETAKEPPDGGVRAYVVVVGSFLTNGLLFGVINSYSLIYFKLVELLKNDGHPNAESSASLVGALTMGTTFLLSPFSGILTKLLGLRCTAVLGGTIATLGLVISSFLTNNVNALCFTYGVMYGIGASLAYTPSLAILGYYFKKYLGLVNGVVTIGSSVFTVIMSHLMHYMIIYHGLDWLLRVLAVSTFGVALCGLLFKPIALTEVQIPREKKTVGAYLKSIINTEIWKNKKYKYWALSMPVALFGYFVPYVHIKLFMEENFPGDPNLTKEQRESIYSIPLQCLAVTSGVGRLVFGYLADKPGIDRILLQQISFYVIGTLTIILPFVTSFPLLIVISLGMGLFDGAFIALIGPIAFELCGAVFAAQAIGCMLGLAAAPLSFGPLVAGYLHSIYHNYTLPFVLAGISPLVGATLMFTIRLIGRGTNRANANGHLEPQSPADVEKSPVPLLAANGNKSENIAMTSKT